MSENGYSTLEIRVRAVDAVLRGQAKGEVANAFSVNRGTLYRWVNRYQQDGDHGLRRKIGSGRPRKLEELKEHELCEIILQPASAFDYETDLWTVGRLHCVITERYQIDVSKDTIWRRLREAGLDLPEAGARLLRGRRTGETEMATLRSAENSPRSKGNTGLFCTSRTRRTFR